MELQLASLISFKVLIYQLGLGAIQVIGKNVGDKFGLMISYGIVILWTLTMTYNGLLILQLIVQSGIGYYLLNSMDEDEN
jgi:hypothetical protein